MQNQQIMTHNLSATIEGRKIFNNVSITIPKHSITTFIGRSGCGKTTFLRSLNRLIDLYPEIKLQGDITVDYGYGLSSIFKFNTDVNLLRQKVGMLFQTPHILPMSIEKNIANPLKLLTDLSKANIQDEVERALKEVGLWGEVKSRLKDSADTLSGGQQQRLCLARILALKPEILLLDEPTSLLDFVATQHIEELLVSIKDRYTIVMVSHSLEQAIRLSDAIYLFKPDQSVEQVDASVLDSDVTSIFFES
ncbi:phosphate ABC transporter ATP-binding protein [Wohlfahrtiimonas populi]|uniref:phosphate ABC transporter ATP-binding protein n=1 Tax=Wohlfahrtiimonas populi TaxID=1940240 RepID=UPI00098D03B2|nr:ATP-binding cassette domain-containing protein [Wohlfahrtiimonas populi]